jgi:hypothetical protein
VTVRTELISLARYEYIAVPDISVISVPMAPSSRLMKMGLPRGGCSKSTCSAQTPRKRAFPYPSDPSPPANPGRTEDSAVSNEHIPS